MLFLLPPFKLYLFFKARFKFCVFPYKFFFCLFNYPKKSPITSLKFFLYFQYTPSHLEFNEMLCADGSYLN